MIDRKTSTEKFLAAALLVAASGFAFAQDKYTIEPGDGCPEGKRVANQQELGTLRPICNRLAPDSILRMKRTPNDGALLALHGLSHGCQIKEYQGRTTASICVALPPPPPPAPGSACYGVPPRAISKVPKVAPTQARFVLHEGEVLRNGEFLLSENRGFFAIQQGEGNFVVYKGWNFANMFGALWATGKRVPGEYFATQQGDGNFAVYQDNGPGRQPGLIWAHQKTASPGQYYTVLENDGNLCTYKGKGPGDISATGRLQLWCSGRTSAAPWIEGRKVVVASSGPARGASLYWGPWPEGLPQHVPPQDRNYPYLWTRPGTEHRWILSSDGTFRLSADQTQCLYVGNESGGVFLNSCKGGSLKNKEYGGSTGWEYCTADGSIRNRSYPAGCLGLTSLEQNSPKGYILGFQVKRCEMDRNDYYGGIAWELH